MTANVNVTKVLFKRGNTAQNATYTGINGEITVDTQAKTLRIHDGVTAGGNVIIAGGVVGSYSNTNAAAYIPTDPTITSLQSNAGIQATAINTINANIGAYQTFANANAATQATGIDTINANLGSFQTYANIHFGDSNYGNTNVAAYLGVFNGNILPAANVTYSLGDSTHQWKDLWVSNNTIYIGNTPIRVDGGTLLVNNAPVSGGSNIGNLQIDNNNNQLSFGPGESYSFLNMKNDGSETRLANDNGNVQISTIKQGPGGGTYYWTFSDLGHLALPFGSQLVTFDSNSVELTAGNGQNSYSGLTSYQNGNYVWVDDNGAYVGTNWSNSAKTWTFGTDGNLVVPGSITYANGASILSDYATISSTLNTSTTSQSTNDFVSGNYYNADTLSVEYTAYTGASTLNFNLGYQKPLDGNIGINVAAISTPLIQSLDGTLTMPVNITGANVISAGSFVSNSFNVVTAGNLSITSQYGLGFTGTILEDNGTLELIAKGGGAVVAGWDSTYGNGLGNIATINFNEVGGEGIVLRTGNRAATEYNWNFDNTGGLTFPTGGNVTFDSSAVSTIDGVTNINAVGTVGANVIQVLDSITSFGASPAPTISGFRSIATTGSAVNEGNISASGNLVAGRNAYVTGNVFAARYNFANGVNILSTVGAGSYGNTQVAAYLPTYTGNVGAARVQVTNAVDFMYGGYPYMGWQLSGSDTLRLRTNIASGDYTNDAIIVDRQSLAVNVVATLTAGNIVTTNGLFWSNGTAYSTGGGSGTDNVLRANVGAYQLFANANVSSIQNQIFASNANIGAFQTYANATFGVSSYGNTQVAAYLLTYPNANVATQNTTSANIVTLRAANFNSANAVISGGYISALTNASIVTATITTVNSTAGNVTTLATSNFSTANAVVTGGYATGLANISVTGNATVGNLIGTSSNTTIVAGAYSSTFDTVGNVVLPSAFVSGNATVMGIAPGYAPNRPAFRIYGSSSNNWTTSNINFKGSGIVVEYNQGNYFNSTTGVFTAPVAGLYSITLNARIGNNNGQNQIMVLKNGLTSAGNVAVMWECDTNTGTAVHYGVSSVMKLVAGDFLTANITVGNVQFDANDSWTVTYLG